MIVVITQEDLLSAFLKNHNFPEDVEIKIDLRYGISLDGGCTYKTKRFYLYGSNWISYEDDSTISKKVV